MYSIKLQTKDKNYESEHHFEIIQLVCTQNPDRARVLAIIYEPVTKGRDLKWDTLPQNQTPSKLFSVLPLESGMFQVTISIIKKWF